MKVIQHLKGSGLVVVLEDRVTGLMCISVYSMLQVSSKLFASQSVWMTLSITKKEEQCGHLQPAAVISGSGDVPMFPL